MKSFSKKFIAFLLAVVLVFGVSVTCFAVENKEEKKNIDVVFIIETSKNIEKKFQEIIKAIKKQVTALESSGVDYQAAVVGFRDVESRTVDKGDYSRISSNFYSNKTDINNYLDKLSLSESTKTDTCLFSAIIDGTSHLKFRNNAVRAFVVIGMTACHDPEPDTGYGVATVKNKFSFGETYPEISPYKFYTYNLGTDTNCEKYYSLLAQNSGGRYTNISSNDNSVVSNSLNSSLNIDFSTIINDLPIIKIKPEINPDLEPDYSTVPLLLRPLYRAAYRIFKVLFDLLKRI